MADPVAPGGAGEELVAEANARAFQHASTGMAVFDLEGRLLQVNPALCAMVGMPAEDLVGNTLSGYARPAHLAPLERWLEAARAGGVGPAQAEAWYTRVDGSRVWLVTEAVAVGAGGPGSTYGLVMVHDRTAAKVLEEALRRSGEMLDALVTSAPVAIYQVDPEGTVLLWNPAAEATFGWTAEEAVGRPLPIVPPDSTAEFAELRRRILGGEVLVGAEVVRRRRDGTEIDLSLWTAPVHDEHGRPVAIMAVALDVTEAKRADAALRSTIIDLKRSQLLVAAHARVLELIARSAPLEEVLAAVTDLVTEHVEGARVGVFLVEDGRLVARGPRQLPSELVMAVAAPPVPGPATPWGAAVAEGRPVTVLDVASDPSVARVREALVGGGIAAVWATPIVDQGTDRTLGALVVFHREARAPAEHERDTLAQAGNLTAIAVDRFETETRLAHQALHDTLTGLPNRTLLLDRLGHALARASQVDEELAVLFVDIDRFKVVNDGLGHGAGDQILVGFAERLRSIVRPDDTIARFGGDEFVVLSEQPDGSRTILAIADRLEDALSTPFTIDDGREVFLTVSMGLAIGRGPTPEVLLRSADAAMYRAKERGRNRLEVFDDAMRADAVARLTLGNDLRRAMTRHEFTVLHQPVVEVATGELVGAEALVRWRHPTRGLLTPDSFIPVTEETGMVVALGGWVLDTALGHARQWADERDRPRFTLSVNVSARQLTAPGLVDQVAHLLQTHRWPADRLCLELTETVLMDDLDLLEGELTQLKALGVHLAIDDFGTGYSSLTYLQRLPVDLVKIDRSFVAGLADPARRPDDDRGTIVRAVVSMAHALGLQVAAEGVDRPEQLDMLAGLGCDFAQGFLFSRPLDAEDFAAALAEGGWPTASERADHR